MNNMKTGLMVAMLGGLIASAETNTSPFPRNGAPRAARTAKRYPRMVTSSREEIAAHNKAVNTRQVRRAKARKDFFDIT